MTSRFASGSDRSTRAARSWTALLAGAVAVFAGVAVAMWPGVSLLVLSQVGGWAMAVLGVVRAIELGRARRARSWAFVGALGGAVLGLTLVVWPGETILVATVLGGAWLVIDGMSRVFDTMATSSLRSEIVGNVLGCLEAVLGVVVIARPVAGVRAAAVVLGAGLVIHGVARMLGPADRAPSADVTTTV